MPKAARRQRASRPRECRLGWPVAVEAMVGIGTGRGLFQNLSSLLSPGMAAEFGWSRGEFATSAAHA